MVDMYKGDHAVSAKITIIIVSFQSVDFIGDNLAKLEKPILEKLVKVIVVDNSSTDGTADFVEKRYPHVKLIRNQINIGFGRGCNCGFSYADTPYVLLINPDAVIDEVSLKKLLSFMDSKPETGICGPAVIDESGAIQPSGASAKPWKVILKPLFPGLAVKGMRNIMPGEPPRQTDWICGSIMMLRSRMIEEIGGFDPRFFLYFEETDLHLRAKKAGWQIWTVGEAVGGHINAASAKATSEDMIWGTISEHYFKSRFYFFRKHYGLIPAVLADVGELFAMFIRYLLSTVRGKKYKIIRQRLRSPIMKSPDIPESNNGGC